MQAILLRLLIALLTFLINIGIVKMAGFAIRQIPKVLKTEQKQSQKPQAGPVSMIPASGGEASTVVLLSVVGERHLVLVLPGNSTSADTVRS